MRGLAIFLTAIMLCIAPMIFWLVTNIPEIMPLLIAYPICAALTMVWGVATFMFVKSAITGN